MSKLQRRRRHVDRASTLGRLKFWTTTRGFAAAEAVLLALVLCGMSLMVGKILIPAAKKAACHLHAELSGSGAACAS
jgi:hypothetical protein